MAQRPNTVRIIGGTHRRRLIRFADEPGLRPTPDRVRETLFNWLGQDLTGLRCLDLFAGSGALGLEAASRGAAEVVLVDSSRRIVQQLNRVIADLGIDSARVLHRDALEFLARYASGLAADFERFDVVFLDPPYGSGLLQRALGALAPTLRPGALVYLECEATPPLDRAWRTAKEGRAGAVHFALLEPEVLPTDATALGIGERAGD